MGDTVWGVPVSELLDRVLDAGRSALGNIGRSTSKLELRYDGDRWEATEVRSDGRFGCIVAYGDSPLDAALGFLAHIAGAQR